MTSEPCMMASYTAGDGYLCHFRHYPAAAPRAHVVCVHGIQSHGGWYGYSCRRLARAGFAVSFLDRRGSGLNKPARGDAPSFRRLLDDMADFLQPVRTPPAASVPSSPLSSLLSPLASLPVFLLAISWGGKLAVALQGRHPGLVDGLALLCPGFCPRVGPTFRERLAILRARLTAPDRLFPVPLSDPALFTACPHWQDFISTDPLALRQATARFLIESVRLDGYLRWAASRVYVPVLMLLAEHDRIIDNARTRTFVERFASPDRQVTEYPGAHHTLEFEPDPDRFVDDLVDWLDRHAHPGSTSPPATMTPP